MIYRGYLIDRLKVFETRKTRWHATYKEAHDSAERLARKYGWGERGEIRVDSNEKGGTP